VLQIKNLQLIIAEYKVSSYSLETIRLNIGYAVRKWAHYDLAATYAFLEDKSNAYEYLVEVDKRDLYPLWWMDLAKFDPMFKSIREEEQFQKFLQNMEAKYQAEHEKVRLWLEENDSNDF
jgi:hypothetical protein